MYLKTHRFPFESYTLAFVYLFGCSITILANAFVIVASLKYGTFKMDRVTIMFVRHLVIADTIFIIGYPILDIIVHFQQRWVFGTIVCYIVGYAISIPGTANINFILAVSIHRYVRCKWPLKAQLITDARARRIVYLTWIISLILIAYFAAFSLTVEFNVYITNCSFHSQDKHYKAIHFTVFVLTVTLPCIIILVINIALWLYVKEITMKSNPSTSSRGCISRFFTRMFGRSSWTVHMPITNTRNLKRPIIFT